MTADTVPRLFARRPPGNVGIESSSPVLTLAPPVRYPGIFRPAVDERLLEVYARADNPDDPLELRDLYLARVEAELGSHGHRRDLARRWTQARVRRSVDPEQVLTSRATVRFVKELFNWYFRDDLYGDLRPQAEVILSGGAVDEEAWGLPWALKETIRYALDRDWYGYSDSRGRDSAREAVARYENEHLPGAPYDAGHVALTMGATFAISALADFILLGARPAAPALCAIPNYPPLVESVARRTDVRLVLLSSRDGFASLDPLIDALTPATPLVLLQTAANPTGAGIPEPELVRLIEAASPETMIVLDECHEWLGPQQERSASRAASNVIRVSSLSKHWSAPGLKVGWIVASRAFIDEYYEYASTTFGGPPSFFYTLVETLARMERWWVSGLHRLGPAEYGEFENSYGLEPATLQAAYDSYRQDRESRAAELIRLRDVVTSGLDLPGIRVIPAPYSINVALDFVDYDDSYRCFREVLRETGVSLFPGILLFCLSRGVVRVTSSRRRDDLDSALRRLSDFAERRPGGRAP